jgi:hypothetical protein
MSVLIIRELIPDKENYGPRNIHSPFNQITRLLGRENFTEFSSRNRFKLCDIIGGLQVEEYTSFLQNLWFEIFIIAIK